MRFIINALRAAPFRRFIARGSEIVAVKPPLKFPARSIHNMADQRPFDQLFQFVKKNTVIPNFLSKISSDHPKAQSLLTAIQSGDRDAKIFEDRDCYLYLLYLMKTEPEPDLFWPCITVYIYLMARMQFREKQAMNNEGDVTRFVPDATIDVMVKENKLTDAGEKFIVSLQQRFKELNYSLDPAELKKFILNLPPVEQWLIKIPFVYSLGDFRRKASLLEVILANVPFCRYIFKPKGQGLFWFPSSSLINYLLQKISPEPMRMVLAFGSPSVNTVRKMHEQGKHPIAMSASDVQSTMTNVHGRGAGSLDRVFHDMFHLWAGTMLLPSERKIIFNIFIPAMEALFKIAAQHQDKELMDKIQKVIEKAGDFDLSCITEFCDNDRLALYLTRALGNYGDESLYPRGKVEFEKIGTVEDRLYFLLLKMQYAFPEGNEKQLWIDIIRFIPTGEYYRQSIVIDAIKQLARHAANLPVAVSPFFYFELDEQDRKEWLTIMAPAKTSAQIWEDVSKENKQYQFIKLLSHGHLLFFHPFLPLSDEMRGSFIAFLRSSRQLNNLFAKIPSKEAFRDEAPEISKFKAR